MSIEQELSKRSQSQCELCGAAETLGVFTVPPAETADVDHSLHLCAVCRGQIDDPATVDVHHWRCLNDSMWSQVPAVQVMAWRMLQRLRGEGWPEDLLEMLYLDDATLAWARSDGSGVDDEARVRHLDCNGTELQAGDSVTLTKDLNVKGANFIAKRGTAVRGISLVSDNPEQLEGRVNGQQIVILTKFVKRAG